VLFTYVYIGKLNIEDIANDQLDDLEITISWTNKQPENAIFQSVKKLLVGKDVKNCIKNKMILFENAYKLINC
jgi:hypothetical protein